MQQTGKSTKSVHYTPDLSLNEALNKADRFLAGISLRNSGSLPSSSVSLIDETMDDNAVPLDNSTQNQSMEAKALAARLI